jgi:hypothetical protein
MDSDRILLHQVIITISVMHCHTRAEHYDQNNSKSAKQGQPRVQEEYSKYARTHNVIK